MSHTVAVLLLAVFCLAGLALIAIGLPGLWLMVAAVVGYGVLTSFHAIGAATIAVVLALALIGEAIEAWLGFGLARRYGGSKRAGWGALLGGLTGAAVGVPVPVIGSVIGSLLGSFAGATILEFTASGTGNTALRAGWGALLGRVAATAAKMALGFTITVLAIAAALRG
jgi:uncharacterized protein YqgC (DUF456 family)